MSAKIEQLYWDFHHITNDKISNILQKCDCQNVLQKLPCIYVCLSFDDLFNFSVRVSSYPVFVMSILMYFSFSQGVKQYDD